MCKHARATVCCGVFPKGTMIAIHQCDMCGALVWRIDTSAIEEDLLTLPMVDAIAMSHRFEKTWKEIMAQPLPTTKKKVALNHDGDALRS